jgi:magnesium transporter
MNIIKHHRITWIDFKDPSTEDIRYLQEHFHIHPVAIEEFITPSYQPKALHYDNCLYLSIHIPLFDPEKRTTYPGELDIILTADHLITGHRNSIYPVEHFFHQLDQSETKRQHYLAHTPAHLLHHILEDLLNSCFPRLEHIAERLDHIESEVFNDSDNEKEMVREISMVKRDILNFRRTLKPQRSILESLIQKDSPFIPHDLKLYYQDLISTNIRVWNVLENSKETIESLEETNNSLLSNKLGLTMKILTVFSAVLLPMTVYTNLLAMTANIPFGARADAFWLHTAITLIIALITIIIFRAKKWF